MTGCIVDIDKACIVFGQDRERGRGRGHESARALAMMDAGASRAEIQDKTGQILGVHDCSLQVQEGEIVVLMGLSGSGKSTLLRAVNGLNRLARGAVRVHDGTVLADVSNADAETWRFFRRSRIAMVFQQFGLLPWRTVADNIAFGLEVAGVSVEERQRRVAAQLEMVHLQGWGDCRISELSGGMQQRVGLARAFASEAPILLMDEPFSALDPLIRVRLQDELLDLQQRLQRTILFVSHDLDEALKIGNRIVIMEGGRIVQIGTPEDIVLSPATPYVADFVAHMNPLKTLRASSVMRPYSGALPANAVRLAADASLVAVVQAKQSGAAAIVVCQDDVPVGIIEEDDIYRALLKEQTAAAVAAQTVQAAQ